MREHQVITTESGDELIVLGRAAYDALLAAAGDTASEARAMRRIAADMAEEHAAGREFILPDWLSDAIMAGETPIKAARLRAGLSQAALAERLGVTQGYMSELETRRKSPAPDLAARLAAALTIEPALLLLDEAEPTD